MTQDTPSCVGTDRLVIPPVIGRDCRMAVAPSYERIRVCQGSEDLSTVREHAPTTTGGEKGEDACREYRYRWFRHYGACDAKAQVGAPVGREKVAPLSGRQDAWDIEPVAAANATIFSRGI